MKIVVGLGNPGKNYEKTRHNAGFMALDFLAGRLGASWEFNKKINGEIIRTENAILLKPCSFMNLSGQAVRALLSYYKLLPKKLGLLRKSDADLSGFLTIIHDDLDLPLGCHKVSVDSRSAGHRGVQSVIGELKTKNFRRLRLGIRTPRAGLMPAEKFVLEKFSPDELAALKKTISELPDFLSEEQKNNPKRLL